MNRYDLYLDYDGAQVKVEPVLDEWARINDLFVCMAKREKGVFISVDDLKEAFDEVERICSNSPWPSYEYAINDVFKNILGDDDG